MFCCDSIQRQKYQMKSLREARLMLPFMARPETASRWSRWISPQMLFGESCYIRILTTRYPLIRRKLHNPDISHDAQTQASSSVVSRDRIHCHIVNFTLGTRPTPIRSSSSPGKQARLRSYETTFQNQAMANTPTPGTPYTQTIPDTIHP